LGNQIVLSAGQLVPAMPGTVGQYTISFPHPPRIKLFQSLKLLINPGATDRALEKFKRNLAQVFPQTFKYFLLNSQILLSAGQLVPVLDRKKRLNDEVFIIYVQ